MTQEDRELLMKDLCARLPYGVRCKFTHQGSNFKATLTRISQYFVRLNVPGTTIIGDIAIEDVKPYLFPLSSMTKEQNEELTDIELLSDEFFGVKTVDWLNRNHFDCRRLIEKGLAIDATNLNIY